MTLADGFRWTEEEWGRALRSEALLTVADHFFTTCQLRLRGADEAEDWARVGATIGVAPGRLVRLNQVHGSRPLIVRRGDDTPHPDAAWPEADIVVSDDPSVAVVVQVADCVPLLMADPRSGAVAAVHAGWRGTLDRAAAAAVGVLATTFGSQPAELIVAQGPSIGACCYRVGADVLAAFRAGADGAVADRWFVGNGGAELALDLWAANRDQLVAAGVRPDAIHQCRLCTASHPGLFHSHRRDGTGTGRLAAVIRSGPPRPSLRWLSGRPRG